MSIFDVALHIPAERSMFGHPVHGRERVLLPLEAQPSLRFFIAAAAVTFMSSACLTMTAVAVIGHGPEVNLLFGAGFAFAAIAPGCIAVTALRDAARALPLLSLDNGGVFDRRLGEGRIGWEAIAQAEIVGAANGIHAVKLTLKSERDARYNPFRFGAWSATWSERKRTRVVALLLLDRRPHTLAHTILALASRHGAKVDAASGVRTVAM